MQSCLALENIQNYHITTGLSENKYNYTEQIENLFKTNITLPESSVIYTKVPRGLIISIESSIFFEENDDCIKEDSKIFLNQIGEVIKFLDKPCVIEGNSAINPEKPAIYSQDWEISIMRAQKITQYLITNSKLNPGKIHPIGFGAMIPELFTERIDFVILNYENTNP